jgi:hypothetical protein
MPREFSMQPFRRLLPNGGGLLNGSEITKDMTLFVSPDNRDEPATIRVNALDACCAVPTNLIVGQIVRARRRANIRDPVVVRIAVAMIDFNRNRFPVR